MADFDLKRPCANCPFLVEPHFELRPGRRQEIADSLENYNGIFTCHKTVTWSEEEADDVTGEALQEMTGREQFCYGALMVMVADDNYMTNGYLRLAERLGMFDPAAAAACDAPVFPSMDAFRTAPTTDDSPDSPHRALTPPSGGVTVPEPTADQAHETQETHPMTDPTDEKEPGRGRGNLERDCFGVVIDVLSGKTKLPETISKLTPHAVGRILKEQDGLEKPPSTGAIAANFVRWGDYGVVNLGTDPAHIKDFTAAFKKAADGKPSIGTLDEFKVKHRAKAAKERAANKPAKADAAKKAPAKKAPAKKAAAKKAPAKKAAAAKAESTPDA